MKQDECRFYNEEHVVAGFGALDAIYAFDIMYLFTIFMFIIVSILYCFLECKSQQNQSNNHTSSPIVTSSNTISNHLIQIENVEYTRKEIVLSENDKKYYYKIYLDTDVTCPINQNKIENKVSTKCGHIFEENNLNDWLVNRIEKGLTITCPSCNQELTKF